MIRRWAVAFVVGAAVLALAAPAQAKGEASKVSITNPGGGGSGSGGPGGGGSGGSGGGGSAKGSTAVLSSPIVLHGLDAGSWLGDSGFFEATPGRPDVASMGPALDVAVTMSCGGHGTPGGMVQQRLFPYASGGALIQTLPGQKFCEGRIGGGWWSLSSSALAMLQQHGLPGTSPLTKTAAPAGGAAKGSEAGSAAARSSASPGRAPWILPVAVGAVAIVIVAGANMAVRRRRRETATTA